MIMWSKATATLAAVIATYFLFFTDETLVGVGCWVIACWQQLMAITEILEKKHNGS